jgi:hypothetical protein
VRKLSSGGARPALRADLQSAISRAVLLIPSSMARVLLDRPSARPSKTLNSVVTRSTLPAESPIPHPCVSLTADETSAHAQSRRAEPHHRKVSPGRIHTISRGFDGHVNVGVTGDHNYRPSRSLCLRDAAAARCRQSQASSHRWGCSLGRCRRCLVEDDRSIMGTPRRHRHQRKGNAAITDSSRPRQNALTGLIYLLRPNILVAVPIHSCLLAV